MQKTTFVAVNYDSNLHVDEIFTKLFGEFSLLIFIEVPYNKSLEQSLDFTTECILLGDFILELKSISFFCHSNDFSTICNFSNLW